jgi:outer membrane protein TolC
MKRLPDSGRARRSVLIVLLVCIMTLALLPPVSAQEAPPGNGGEKRRLTMDEAVDLAIKNNLTLASNLVSLDTKKRKADLVWNQFLPELDVRGTLARDNKAAASQGFSLPDGTVLVPPTVSPQWHMLGNFTVVLNLSAAMFSGIRAIKQDYQAGLLGYEKAKVQTERDVRKAYNQMLNLQENVTLLKESFALAERQVSMAQANYRAGLAPQLTLLQAQVSRDNLKPAIDQAENGLKISMANFAMSLNLPYDTQFELVPVEEETVLIPLDVKELISRASRNRPDILEIQQNILLLKSSREVQFLQLYTPYLNISWSLQPAFLGDPWKDSWIDGGNWKEGGTLSFVLGMNLNSLFPFTKQGQGLKDIDNNIQTASIGLAQMIRGTELDIYNTVLSLEKTQVNIETQNQTVDLARQSYQLTEEAYRAGLTDFLQVQNAELELRKARVGAKDQYYSYLNGLIDLEYAAGVPFGTLTSGKNTLRSE